MFCLLGFRIDFDLVENRFTLLSVFAEREQDVLQFRVVDDKVEMLATPFVQALDEDALAYVKQYNSFPAFLAALTLRLFEQTTVLPSASEGVLCVRE